MRRRTLSLTVAVTASSLLTPPLARAQEPVISAAADLITGLEGGSSGDAAGVRRARTTLRLGGELAVDERPADVYSAAAIIEMEPVATIGADLRYLRLVDDFALHVGAIGIIAPKYMLGATLGAQYRLPLHERVTLSVGPAVHLYFLGSDLPEQQVLWQGLVQAGVRVPF